MPLLMLKQNEISNELFQLIQNEKELNKVAVKTKIDEQYIKTLYNLLLFHRYKPYSLNKLASVKEENIIALNKIKIKNNGDILLVCSSNEKRKEIVIQTKIPEKELDNIITMSDLIRKPGIKEIKAILFMKVGIKTLYDLGLRKSIILREELRNMINKEKMDRAIPTEKEIKSDIAWAKIYPRIIK